MIACRKKKSLSSPVKTQAIKLTGLINELLEQLYPLLELELLYPLLELEPELELQLQENQFLEFQLIQLRCYKLQKIQIRLPKPRLLFSF